MSNTKNYLDLRSGQEGFHMGAIVLLIVALGVAGFIAYRVLQANTKEPTSTTSTAQTQNTHKWTEGDFAAEGTYADADVVKIADDTWRLYYSIQPEVPGNRFEVYSSTSHDGKTWTKEAGVRKTMATFPEVVKLPNGTYRMYYQQGAVIKSAISTDGLTFNDEAGTRIDKANDVGLVFDNVAAPTVLMLDDGSYMLVYRGTINTRYAADTPNPTTQLLMWATSADGLTFTKKGIAVDSRNDTLRGQLDGPDLVKWDDAKTHVFATTYAGVYEFVFDGSKFSSGTLAYALAQSQPTPPPPAGGAPVRPPDAAPPGDPTTAKINGTWFMFYGGSRDKNGIRYATYQ